MRTIASWLRRFAPLVVLVAVATGAWTVAAAADRDEAATEPERYEVALVDPVLSARRIPRALQAPIVEQGLRPYLDALVGASPPASCLVVDVAGRELYRHNADLALVPASNHKLLTTWTALHTLGPDFRYETPAVTDAAIEGGVLRGNLWLVGSGDPFLTTDPWMAQFEDGGEMVRTRLEDLADAIAATGITEIAGSVVGDESRFDQVRIVPTWAERLVDQNQAGPLSALMVNEGIVRFPDEYVSRRNYLPAPDPAIHTATLVSQLLGERGVRVVGPPGTGPAPPAAVPVAAVQSPPLSELLRGVNAWSNNTAAELLVKTIDRAAGGTGSTAGGTAIIAAALTDAGFPTAGLVVNDGSGLDEGNRATCPLLHAVLQTSGPESPLGRSLAVGGTTGTLRTRFVDSPATGQVRAKSGTLRSVTALSGYATSTREPDTVLTFAYLANLPPDGVIELRLIDQQEPFAASLAEYPQGPTLAQLAPRDPRAAS